MRNRTQSVIGLLALVVAAAGCSSAMISGPDAHGSDATADVSAADRAIDSSITDSEAGSDATTADDAHFGDATDAFAATDAAGPAPCIDDAPAGDIGTYGFTRQCSGSIRSYNTTLHPVWNNLYSGLMSADFPGSAAQFGYGLAPTFYSPTRFASFWFNSGSTPAGVQIQPNQSVGSEVLLSISTMPGDFFSGTAICVGSTLNISNRPSTPADCPIAQDTGYYLNFAMVDLFAPHESTCTTSPCTAGFAPYLYTN